MDITTVVKHYQIWTCVITGSRAKLKFLLQKKLYLHEAGRSRRAKKPELVTSCYQIT